MKNNDMPELIDMNKVQEYLHEMANNARDNGYPLIVDAIQSVQDHLLEFVHDASLSSVAPEKVEVIELDRPFSEVVLDAVEKSNWIPKEYTMNDIESDVRAFLRGDIASIPLSQLKEIFEGMKKPDHYKPELKVVGYNAALDAAYVAAEKAVR